MAGEIVGLLHSSAGVTGAGSFLPSVQMFDCVLPFHPEGISSCVSPPVSGLDSQSPHILALLCVDWHIGEKLPQEWIEL